MSNEPRSDEELTQQKRDAFGKEIKALMVNTSEQLLAIADEYGVDRGEAAGYSRAVR